MNILIIEDTPFWGKYLCKELSKYDYSSKWVRNGRLGVEELKQGSIHYDGIICDVQMPWMCGIEATRAIRLLGFKKPIVGFSSMKATYEAQCLAAGMDACFEKSINPSTMKRLFECLGLPCIS